MTDNRTLDEIREDHGEQVKWIEKNCQDIKFNAAEPAYIFRQQAVTAALEYMGMPKNAEKLKPKMVEMLMRRHRIRIESKEENPNASMFIYKLKPKEDEIDHLAFYVSGVYRYKPLLIIAEPLHWKVRTNVLKEIRNRKIISIPKAATDA